MPLNRTEKPASPKSSTKVIFVDLSASHHTVASSPDNKSKVEKILDAKNIESNPSIEHSSDERTVDIAQRDTSLASSSSPSLTQPAAQLNGLISSEYPFCYVLFVLYADATFKRDDMDYRRLS